MKSNFETSDLYLTSNRIVAHEMLSQLAWRLPVLSLLTGSWIIFNAFMLNYRDPFFITLWICIAVLEIIAGIMLFRQNLLPKISQYAFILEIGMIVWLILPIQFALGSQVLSEIALLLLVLFSGLLPRSRRHNITRGGITFSVAVLLAPSSPLPFVFLFVLMVAWFISLRASSVIFFDMISRTTMPLLVSACERFASSRDTIRMLGWHLGIVGDTEQVAIIFGNRKLEILSSYGAEDFPADDVMLKAVRKVIEVEKQEVILVDFSKFGKQFELTFLDWFGFVPSSLIFIRLTAVLEEKEQDVMILIPIRWEVRLFGVDRLLSAVTAMSAIVRMSLGAVRGRFMSADKLKGIERSLDARDEELNKVTHEVNNFTQMATASVEGMLININGAKEVSDLDIIKDAKQRTLAILEEARYLSTNVSDIRWMREILLGVTKFETRDLVPVIDIIEILQEFMQMQLPRKGVNGEVVINGDLDGTSISVVSREFLESALRTLIREGTRRAGHGGMFQIEVSRIDDMIEINFIDSGKSIPLDKRAWMVASASGAFSGIESDLGLHAANEITRVSSGDLFFVDTDKGNQISLTFPTVTPKIGDNFSSSSGWILLVDDQAEVSTFYSRVAAALKLNYATASSVAESLKLVEQKGAPQLVVTDVQLGDGSGIDLVDHLRDEFGFAFPIIVVSGATDEGIRERAREAGVNRFITKPLSRKKLFDEIALALSLRK